MLMIAVIFEVEPAEGRKDDYLAIAANLRPILEEIDGFISIERFQSLANPGRILSLSFFRDEEAVKAWRTTISRPRRHLQRLPPAYRVSRTRLRPD
jgi:heme-degrading monooxygenase HmoA